MNEVLMSDDISWCVKHHILGRRANFSLFVFFFSCILVQHQHSLLFKLKNLAESLWSPKTFSFYCDLYVIFLIPYSKIKSTTSIYIYNKLDRPTMSLRKPWGTRKPVEVRWLTVKKITQGKISIFVLAIAVL